MSLCLLVLDIDACPQVLLHVLAPRSPQYFARFELAVVQPATMIRSTKQGNAGEDDAAAENGDAAAAAVASSEPVPTSRKDPAVRRAELLDALLEPLARVCLPRVSALVRSLSGARVLQETLWELAARGAAGVAETEAAVEEAEVDGAKKGGKKKQGAAATGAAAAAALRDQLCEALAEEVGADGPPAGGAISAGGGGGSSATEAPQTKRKQKADGDADGAGVAAAEKKQAGGAAALHVMEDLVGHLTLRRLLSAMRPDAVRCHARHVICVAV